MGNPMRSRTIGMATLVCLSLTACGGLLDTQTPDIITPGGRPVKIMSEGSFIDELV